jgi:hypothetical protein
VRASWTARNASWTSPRMSPMKMTFGGHRGSPSTASIAVVFPCPVGPVTRINPEPSTEGGKQVLVHRH